jgi:hypothetical protein
VKHSFIDVAVGRRSRGLIATFRLGAGEKKPESEGSGFSLLRGEP